VEHPFVKGEIVKKALEDPFATDPFVKDLRDPFTQDR